MKFCANCGKELLDEALICPGCGCQVSGGQQPVQPAQPVYQQPAQPVYQQPVQPGYQQPVQPGYQQGYQQPYQQPYQPPVQPGYYAPVPVQESPGFAIAAIVLAFLIPIAGLIMGIVGLGKYKNTEHYSKCIAAIVISIVVWIFNFIIIMASWM